MDIFKNINRELALFAGAGGGILGSSLFGLQTVGAVEIQKYPCGVLQQRQNDGSFHPFPIWTDIRSFSKRNNQCRAYIKWLKRYADKLLISGGFPCQDISVAGKGEGIDGKNSGLWREYFRVVCEIRPAAVYVENSPMLTSRGLDRVLGNLAKVGYDAVWGVLAASDVGANHKRERIWILAYLSNSDSKCLQGMERKSQQGGIQRQAGLQGREGSISGAESVQRNTANSDNVRRTQKHKEEQSGQFTQTHTGNWWETEPDVGRVVNGLAFRVDRIKAIGNGQVPATMAGSLLLLRELIR